MVSDELSLRQARWTALEAQGFGRRHRPSGPVTAARLAGAARRLAVVQIDSVNVVTRSHYLPFLSRLGPYDPTRLDRLRDTGPRRLVEYWAHEASLIPVEAWPLYGFRMRRAEESWGSMQHVAREHPRLVEEVLAAVADLGPVTARELEDALVADAPRRTGHWGWNWSAVKSALEHLFWTGRVTSAGRTAGFARRYDLPERVLPSEVVERGPHGRAPIPEDEALAALVERAARAVGVGTERDLRDHSRLSAGQVRPAITRLVDDGVLRPVRVEGWRRPAYLHTDARVPARRPHATTLLSPFDSLIWQRDRTRDLFGFDYRLEIYVPAPRRVHGYYVLPLLLDDRLVARADVKADRPAGVLSLRAVHVEDGCDTAAVHDRLHHAASELASFLGLERVAPTTTSGAPLRGTLDA